MKTILFHKKKQKKCALFDLNFDQTQAINKIYLNINFNQRKTIERELQKKLHSYTQQDKKKKREICQNITFNELIEELVISKLRCFYCKTKICCLYNDKREPTQWTLDRINNKKSHTKDNIVISCLKCNLEKRCRSKEKFRLSKQMKIIKKI